VILANTLADMRSPAAVATPAAAAGCALDFDLNPKFGAQRPAILEIT
jgi:hypothetical protein